MKEQFVRFRRHYVTLSVMLTNAFLLLLAVNLVIAARYLVLDLRAAATRETKRAAEPDGAPPEALRLRPAVAAVVDLRSYGSERETALETLSDAAALDQLGIDYTPYIQFTQPRFRSRHINILHSRTGFAYRSSGRPGTPDDRDVFLVFLFGGSTAFGSGVSDAQTMASHLELELQSRFEAAGRKDRVRVVNFGHGYFFPSQEHALFARLLQAGYRPRVALFLDGINWEAGGDPHHTVAIRELIQARQLGLDRDYVEWLPMFRLLNGFRRHRREDSFAERFAGYQEELERRSDVKEAYLATYRQIGATAREFKTVPLFLWQPNRFFGCDDGQYRSKISDFPASYAENVRKLYTAMGDFRADDFVHLEGACKDYGAGKRIIVDDIHYSPDFNRYLAHRVADVLIPKIR